MKAQVRVLANRLEIERITEENRVNDAEWIKKFEKDNSIGKFEPQEVPEREIETRDMFLDASGIQQAYHNEYGMIAMFYHGRELLVEYSDELMEKLEERFKNI